MGVSCGRCSRHRGESQQRARGKKPQMQQAEQQGTGELLGWGCAGHGPRTVAPARRLGRTPTHAPRGLGRTRSAACAGGGLAKAAATTAVIAATATATISSGATHPLPAQPPSCAPFISAIHPNANARRRNPTTAGHRCGSDGNQARRNLDPRPIQTNRQLPRRNASSRTAKLHRHRSRRHQAGRKAANRRLAPPMPPPHPKLNLLRESPAKRDSKGWVAFVADLQESDSCYSRRQRS
jgi:hypothetical protein